MAERTVEQITTLIEPILSEHQLMLWDMTFQKEGSWVLRILLDKQDHQPITMEEITSVSEAINELLDTTEPDPIPQAYLLDIASPGADRLLTKPAHWDWAVDQVIDLKLFQKLATGQKELTGKLTSNSATEVVVEFDQESIHLAHSDIAKANIAILD